MNSFAETNVGIKAGMNFSNVNEKFDGTKNDENKMLLGYHAGLYADFDLIGESIQLETGLTLENKGSKYEEKFLGKKIDVKTSLTYLTIPVNARLNLDVAGLKVYGLAGPTIGVAISGKYKSDDESEDIDFGSKDSEMKRLNIGLLVGAGITLENNFGFRVGYDVGLSNLSNADKYKYKTGTLSLSLTYDF